MNDQSIQTYLRYLIPGDEKPVYIASQGGADAQLSIQAQFESREVMVTDARTCLESFSLDTKGFVLADHHTTIGDFYQLEAHQQAYEAELCELVLGITGGSEVMVFDHTLRSDSATVRGDNNTREPAGVIHNDYTDASAQKRVRDLLPAAEADARLAERFCIVNVWRSIAGAVLNSPLACCDALTIERADLVASERRAKERIGELELAIWNPDHRWYYYPAMSPAEALLIKTYDSCLDGRARRSIHTAFDNPLAPAEAPPRESLESRMLVFY